MRIGIDLDNTIIFYDDAFLQAAIVRGLLPAGFIGTKQQVRDAIRLLKDGETEWQKLQGYIYGKGLPSASLFPGVDAFLRQAREARAELFIVSHKTELGHFDPERINLRDAARLWLRERGFFSGDPFGMKEERVLFAATRAEKVSVIAELKLDWFIDDLVEVYEESHFPAGTRKILFHSAPHPAPQGDWIACNQWEQIKDTVFP